MAPLEFDPDAELFFGSALAAVVADALGVRPSTLANWRRKGTGPAFMRLGRSFVLYPLEDLNRWWLSPAARRTRRRRERRANLQPAPLRPTRAAVIPTQGHQP